MSRHLFFDESGGYDTGRFLGAAVLISPDRAVRLMRRLQKRVGLAGEIKGHALGADGRAAFFELLRREDLFAAAVVCHRGTPLASWAMSTFPEPVVYGELVVEACHQVPGAAGASGLTADGGRYKRSVLDGLRASVATSLIRLGMPGMPIAFRDSAAVAGLQVADIIANSVFQLGSGSGSAAFVETLVGPLLGAGRIRILDICLPTRAPAWLQNATKPPEGGFEAVDATP